MKILNDLPPNARYPILLDPLWAVFGGMILFYAPLYMKELGISEVEMGFINTCNILAGFIFFFFAGTITNKTGRKKTTLIFDIISWTIPMFIWAIARNFWYFLAAAVINAAVKVVFVSWSCLVTEDTPPHKRAKVFGAYYIINYTCYLFTPVAGVFISLYGTVPAMRVIYILGLISMTSAFIIRNAFITETSAGKDIMDSHCGLSIAEGLKNSISTAGKMVKNRSLILITLIFIVSNFIVSVNFFQVIFLKEHLGFSETVISLVPVITAVMNLLLYALIIPRLSRYTEELILTISIAVTAVGALFFVFIPKNSLVFLILTIVFFTAGSFVMQAYRDSVLMNHTGEHEKADMCAAVQTVTTLFCIPAGFIGGLAYSNNPLLPYIIIFALLFLTIPVSVSLRKQRIKRIFSVPLDDKAV